MQAVVLQGPHQLALLDVPRPTLTDEHHVLIEVRACGSCGSDLRYWAGENPWAMHTLGRHEPNPPNMILGHEFAGVVVEVNSSRYEHLLGQAVGAQAWRRCGHCALCRAGHENLCANTLHIGHGQGWGQMPYFPGAYADYCLAWGDLVYPMRPEMPYAEEALRDIVGVSAHAVGRACIGPGDTVLCLGGGPVGLCLAQVAQARGADRVYLVDPSPLAQWVIAQYEGLVGLDPNAAPLAEQAPGLRCAAILDTVGSAETFAQALPLLAEAGIYVNLAVHDLPLALNARALGSERCLTSSSNALYRDEREAHELLASGAVRVAPMISHRLPLAAYQQAYDLLLSEPRGAYKVVFELGGKPPAR